MVKRFILVMLAAGCCAAASAKDFPSKPLRIVVPWPPSGNVDITARTLAPAFSEALGQQVIVENRAGAGGTIGTAQVVKSPADGYTLLLGSSGTVTSGPAVFKNLAYDPLKDLVAIGPIQSVPIVLTAAPKTPVATFQEYVALAQARPGQLSIASAGSGSSNHLGRERGGEGINSPGFTVIRRRLAERDDCWTKISSFYRLSDSGPPGYDDMRPFVQTLLKERPNRCVWGTNWPHPGLTKFMPNDADLLDLLEHWIPSESARTELFAANAKTLYRLT